MKTLFFVCLSLFILTSCTEPDPIIEEEPKAKGIFYCLIDGERFRAKGFNQANQWSPNPDISYSEASGSLSLLVFNGEEGKTLDILGSESPSSPGQIILSEYSEFKDNSKGSCRKYWLS